VVVGGIETIPFFPTGEIAVSCASLRVKRPFPCVETISMNLPLFLHLLTRHVIFSAYVASHLMEIETTINAHWECPKGSKLPVEVLCVVTVIKGRKSKWRKADVSS
jgi:hypothetical protein